MKKLSVIISVLLALCLLAACSPNTSSPSIIPTGSIPPVTSPDGSPDPSPTPGDSGQPDGTTTPGDDDLIPPTPGTLLAPYDATIEKEGMEEPVTLTPVIGSYGYTIDMLRENHYIFSTNQGVDTVRRSYPGVEENVYISIYPAEDGLSAQEIADGLVLQSGRDDVETKNSTFGKEAYPATQVSYRAGDEDDAPIMSFYITQRNGKLYIIERCMDTSLEAFEGLTPELNLMLNTFTFTE